MPNFKGVGKMSSGRPNVGKPNDDRPNVGKPNVGKPNVDRLNVRRPNVEKRTDESYKFSKLCVIENNISTPLKGLHTYVPIKQKVPGSGYLPF
jgi:hypothetical protein